MGNKKHNNIAYVMYFEKSKSYVDLQNDLKTIVKLFDNSFMIY